MKPTTDGLSRCTNKRLAENKKNSGGSTTMSTPDELEAAFKKAAKGLEGEKRAAIKKAKATKGKKAKDAIAAVEEEYAFKLEELRMSHEQQLSQLLGTLDVSAVNLTLSVDAEKHEEEAVSVRDRKQDKARRKRERQKEREAQRKKELDEEITNAGPSPRDVELEQIQRVLKPLNLKISEVEADGNCLYRAVGAQTNLDFSDVRILCADTLKKNEDEFAPFCEYTGEITCFNDYVDSVRNSSEWGGHLELRALGMALDRPIHVYSVQSGSSPLTIHESDNAPIRLSYHLHYYALGEHYNRVMENE